VGDGGGRPHSICMGVGAASGILLRSTATRAGDLATVMEVEERRRGALLLSPRSSRRMRGAGVIGAAGPCLRRLGKASRWMDRGTRGTGKATENHLLTARRDRLMGCEREAAGSSKNAGFEWRHFRALLARSKAVGTGSPLALDLVLEGSLRNEA
jgi:hypothetical protein